MANGRKGKNHQARRVLEKPVALTAAQSELWDYTVDAQSASWQIPGMEPLLHEFVVTACYLRRLYIRREKEEADPDFSVREVESISEAISTEARKLAAVMTKLRLTPQSRTKETSPQVRPGMPWDMHPEDEGDTA